MRNLPSDGVAVTGTSSSSTSTLQAPGPTAKPSAGQEEEGLFFNPPLYSQRAQLVHHVLQRYHCRRIVDAGCSYGDLLLFIMNASSLSHAQVTHVTAIDLDRTALGEVARVLPYSSSFSCAAYTADCAVQCLHGDLTSSAAVPAEWLPYPCTSSPQGAGCCDGSELLAPPAPTVDAVFSIEVVEHIPPHLVAAYTYTLFAQLGAARGARVVLLTTPNRDENHRLPRRRHAQPTDGTTLPLRCSVYCPSEDAPRRRHNEHFFELTRAQWRRYVRYIEACYGEYWQAQETVLLGKGFTQGTLFVAREGRHARHSDSLNASVYARAAHGARSHRRGTDRKNAPSEPPLRTTPSLPAQHKEATMLSRDAAIAAFPFEEIFGMSESDYTAQVLSATSPPLEQEGERAEATATPEVTFARRSLGGDVAYSRVDHRVVNGVPLWERLREVVRRGATNMLPRDSTSKGEAMAFGVFYTTHLQPLLLGVLEACALPLLVRCLSEQRALWKTAAHDDAVRWKAWLRRESLLLPLLRACPLHPGDAHTRHGSHRAQPMALSTVSSAGSAETPLFPFPSTATAVLSSLAHDPAAYCGDARWAASCAEGLQLLRRGTTDSVGLLLVTWLATQVESCAAASTAKEVTSSCPPAVPHANAATLPPSHPVRTMKALPTYLLQLLFFLVSVDVLPDAYAALCGGWGSLERHLLALHRDVCAISSTASSPVSLASAVGGRGGDGGGRRVRQQRRGSTSPCQAATTPQWLSSLLQTAVSTL